MGNKQEIMIPERMFVGLLLAFAGGFLDAYTYVLRGGVFCNAQTGNIVLLGVEISAGNWAQASAYLMPILAFVFGVFVTGWLSNIFHTVHHIHWRQIVLAVELVILFYIGFLPLTAPSIWVNILISFVSAVQVTSFRKLEGVAYSTTMCTGNLRTAADYFYRYITTKEKRDRTIMLQFLSIILAFIVGAAASSLCSRFWLEHSVWLCCLVLLVVLIYLYCSEDNSKPTA